MPRITEGTVAEHVAKQEAAVFEAAIRLFTERGYSRVSLADIAAEVGLARNSLYRYFPGKPEILLRWIRQELTVRRERSCALLGGEGTPSERIRRWAVDQLDYARRPEHDLVATLPDLVPGLDESSREELAGIHRELLAPLGDALADAGFAAGPDRDATAELIFGLVLSGARWEERAGRDELLRSRLTRAIDSLVITA